MGVESVQHLFISIIVRSPPLFSFLAHSRSPPEWLPGDDVPPDIDPDDVRWDHLADGPVVDPDVNNPHPTPATVDYYSTLVPFIVLWESFEYAAVECETGGLPLRLPNSLS